jgi:hypothetical protein
MTTKSITIDGVRLGLHDSDHQAVSIDGRVMSLETFLKLTQIALTNTDLRGTDIDGVDPRFKFIAMVRHSGRVDGFSAGAKKLAHARYASMFNQDSTPPMAR